MNVSASLQKNASINVFSISALPCLQKPTLLVSDVVKGLVEFRQLNYLINVRKKILIVL